MPNNHIQHIVAGAPNADVRRYAALSDLESIAEHGEKSGNWQIVTRVCSSPVVSDSNLDSTCSEFVVEGVSERQW